MMSKPHLITADGLVRLTAELEELQTNGREALAERLHRAFSDGQDDEFVDNAELEAARHDQSFLEGRIQELEDILRNHEIIDRSNNSNGIVQVGDEITIKEIGEDDEETYMLVGAAEADPSEGRISNESPLGEALLGAKLNKKVSVEAPGGKIKFQVVSIN